MFQFSYAFTLDDLTPDHLPQKQVLVVSYSERYEACGTSRKYGRLLDIDLYILQPRVHNDPTFRVDEVLIAFDLGRIRAFLYQWSL